MCDSMVGVMSYLTDSRSINYQCGAYTVTTAIYGVVLTSEKLASKVILSRLNAKDWIHLEGNIWHFSNSLFSCQMG